MKPTKPLQPLIDAFVQDFGGELVAEIAGANPSSKNADYLFRSHNIIAELKALENDSFSESLRRKLGQLMGDWHKRGLFKVYGTRLVDSKRLPPVCQQEMFDLLARPFQDNFIAKANRQIEETGQLLNMPAAKGVLMVASDGNEDLAPYTVWYLLSRILQKTHPGGSMQFSHIHGLIYFTPRMPVENPETGERTMIWYGAPRRSGDVETRTFIIALGRAWPQHVSKVSGRQFQEEVNPIKPMNLEAAKFADIAAGLPKIDVSD